MAANGIGSWFDANAVSACIIGGDPIVCGPEFDAELEVLLDALRG